MCTELTGRTLNVISLAGLAFAVGMVLDAAIVVLENIIRLREKRSSLAATQQADNQAVSDKSHQGDLGDLGGLSNQGDLAEQGTKQVWSALLAST
ncbi:acriflavin resistance protein [Photobacterium aphoticum]|uniref:Acriflavin resistance protein n=1 Tax=Photobacterium aphoticum TaxID=754436 RepID=A0A090QXT8_9GAMM|nr:acriflavin resistance protein [Photobacterium aphoticum]